MYGSYLDVKVAKIYKILKLAIIFLKKETKQNWVSLLTPSNQGSCQLLPLSSGESSFSCFGDSLNGKVVHDGCRHLLSVQCDWRIHPAPVYTRSVDPEVNNTKILHKWTISYKITTTWMRNYIHIWKLTSLLKIKSYQIFCCAPWHVLLDCKLNNIALSVKHKATMEFGHTAMTTTVWVKELSTKKPKYYFRSWNIN